LPKESDTLSVFNERNITHMKQTILLLLILVITMLSGYAETPTNTNAFFRSGQVFITWNEVVSAEKYIVYRSLSAFSAGDLTALNKRYEVPQGSANNKHLNSLVDYRPESNGFMALTPPCSIRKHVIIPLSDTASGNAVEVADGTGMVVLTTHTVGTYYYAITAVVGGVEDKSLNNGNITGAIEETVEEPTPVLLWQSGIKEARIYLQYTDVDSFNPTYTGEYAWPYWVGVGTKYNTTSEKLSLCLGLAGMPGTLSSLGNSYSWNSQGIECKTHETGNWWFGYSQTAVYDTSVIVPTCCNSGAIREDGPVVNFTEARYMNFLKWMILREPYYSTRIDTNRIFTTGASMGGSGTLQFMHHYPDFFAYGIAKTAVTNYLETDWSWLRQCETRWGSHTNDTMQVKFTGWRSEWLNESFGGMTLHTFLNQENMLFKMERVEMPWIFICHGGTDGSVNWPQQGRNYYTNLDSTRRGWSGGCDGASGHYCSGVLFAIPNGNDDQTTTIRKNNSFVAFSNVSGNPGLPVPDSPDSIYYSFNTQFNWSTPYYRVGGYQDQIDSVNRYEIVLVSRNGDNIADITPRRLQKFVVTPGEEYIARNTAVNDLNTVFQVDTLTADSLGLLTFKGFEVKAGDKNSGGSRLIVVPLNFVSGVSCNRESIAGNLSMKCYPNPFNPATIISIVNHGPTTQSLNVIVRIFNAKGVLVHHSLPLRIQSAVPLRYAWDATLYPSGLYVVKISAGDQKLLKRIIFMK